MYDDKKCLFSYLSNVVGVLLISLSGLHQLVQSHQGWVLVFNNIGVSLIQIRDGDQDIAVGDGVQRRPLKKLEDQRDVLFAKLIS